MAVFNLWLAKILIWLEWFIFHLTGRKGKCSQETRCVLLALLDIRHRCFPGFASQQRRHQQKNPKDDEIFGPFLMVCHFKNGGQIHWGWFLNAHPMAVLAWPFWIDPPKKTKVWLMVDMTHEHAGILYVIYVYIYIILYYIILYYIILYYIILYYIILYFFHDKEHII